LKQLLAGLVGATALLGLKDVPNANAANTYLTLGDTEVNNTNSNYTGMQSSTTDSKGTLYVVNTGSTNAIHGASTNGNGVYGYCNKVSGFGVYGANNSGKAVYGLSQVSTGVYGESVGGNGVEGRATATSGTTAGVRGQSDSSSGIGVIGLAGNAGAKPIVAKGASGQTANLQEWQDNAGSPLSVVDKIGWLGVGAASPVSPIHVMIPGDQPASTIAIRAEGENRNVGAFFYAYSPGNFPFFSGRRARGTIASPSAVQSGDLLMRYGGAGYGATSFPSGNRATLEFYAAENWTDTAQGTYVTIGTTATGSITVAERLRVTASGNIGIGTATPASRLHVTSDSPTLDDTGIVVEIPGIGARRIIVGPPNSAGTGFRALRVAN